jgi:Zn-dependent peptidase ImmA (M78 family)
MADVFASHLLMPTESVRRAVNPLISDGRLKPSSVHDISRQFDVPMEALVWRIRDIYGFDTEPIREAVERYRQFAKVWKTREKGETPSRPGRFLVLAERALRSGEISLGRFAEYIGITRQEAMRFLDREISEDVTIKTPT